MRLAVWLALPLAVAAQIGKPPEFQETGKIQSSDAARQVDGTTHVSADRAETNARLTGLLKDYPAAGPAVEKYLAGDLAGSAQALLALPADLRVLPFLGEMAATSPTLRPRIAAIAEAYPASADAAYYLGRASDFPESIPLLRLAAGRTAASTSALLELGRQYANHDMRPEAIAAYEEVLTRDPEDKTAHFRLAQLYRAAGETEKSREHLRLYRRR